MNTTVRDLRTLLFQVDNQSMTVRQLRHLLFNQEVQDNPASTGIAQINARAPMDEDDQAFRDYAARYPNG